jgi:hypothetical protein
MQGNCPTCGTSLDTTAIHDINACYRKHQRRVAQNNASAPPMIVVLSAPRTYEQGLADGMRKMAEAACKVMCTLCESGLPARWNDGSYWHDSLENPNYGAHYCAAQTIRRVLAKAEGIDLSAAPREKEEG